MPSHVTKRTWSPDQLDELKGLVEAGGSPTRAAARFNRSKSAVQIKAKKLGFPFKDVREVKRNRRRREEEARRELRLS